MEQMPFNTEKFKKIAGENCVAEDVNYMPRSNIGMKNGKLKRVTATATVRLLYFARTVLE